VSCRTDERLELLRHAWVAQTGQFFMLYDDALRKIEHWLEKIARTISRSRCAMNVLSQKSPDFIRSC
jgi:hypothetical protein